jgi:hypothetical protein
MYEFEGKSRRIFGTLYAPYRHSLSTRQFPALGLNVVSANLLSSRSPWRIAFHPPHGFDRSTSLGARMLHLPV